MKIKILNKRKIKNRVDAKLSRVNREKYISDLENLLVELKNVFDDIATQLLKK